MAKYSYPLLSLFIFLAVSIPSSLFFSINTLQSSSQLFLWAIYGCIFLASLTVPIRYPMQKNLLLLIFILSSLLFILSFFNSSLFVSFPKDSYQFIFRVGNDEHNHLGDIAGLAVSSLLLNLFPIFISIPLLLFGFIIMAISFSKSAFLGVLAVSFFLAVQKRGKYLWGFFIILLVSIICISIYTKELSGIPPIKTAQKIMFQTLHLSPKPILSVRDFYYPQVIRAWTSAPLEQLLFGYGPGNYIYPSIKTALTEGLTPSKTHNILLGIFIENGILSLFWFLIFCILIIVIGIKQKNPSVYIFIYLLANFQTDYTYVIPFFMIMFFAAAGQSLHAEGKKANIKSRSFVICSLFLLILTLFSGLHFYTIQQDKNNLDTQLKKAVIKLDKTTIQGTIAKLELITPYETGELIQWSLMEEIAGNNAEAVRLLEKISVYSPRAYLTYLPHQLDLQIKTKVDIKKYIEKRKKDFATFPFIIEEKNKLNEICKKYTNGSCVK